MEKIFFYENTPVGKLCIGEKEGAITRVTWQQLPKEWVLAVSYTHLTLPTICSV